MSQDVVADALNQIMNAKKVEKKNVKIRRYSKVLIGILEHMKAEGHLDYRVDEENRVLEVEIISLNKCLAIKPRFTVRNKEIGKYLRRFLPSRNFGTIIISTNRGLVSHKEALEKNLGGCLIAYYY